jgi:hypothetical protein
LRLNLDLLGHSYIINSLGAWIVVVVVVVVVQIYQVTAIQFVGSSESGLGMPGISKWAAAQRASMDKSKAANTNQMDTMRATFGLMKLHTEFAMKMEKAKTEEEKQALQKELAEASQETMLKIFWTTTVVDITSTLHETLQMVFFDQSVDKETRKRRAVGVKALGEIFQACPEPSAPEGQAKKTAGTLYEEAAFAAMLETIKRKDEAAHEAALS